MSRQVRQGGGKGGGRKKSERVNRNFLVSEKKGEENEAKDL